MTAFGKRKGGGRRSAEREHLPLIAVFTTRTRSHHALLVDLSSTGAHLRGNDLPERDEDLMLSVEGVLAYEIVRWSRLGYCGVAFDSPLRAGDLRSLEHKVLKARGLPPDIVTAMEDWTLGVAH